MMLGTTNIKNKSSVCNIKFVVTSFIHISPRSYKPYTHLIKFLFYDTESSVETIHRSLSSFLPSLLPLFMRSFINLFFSILPWNTLYTICYRSALIFSPSNEGMQSFRLLLGKKFWGESVHESTSSPRKAVYLLQALMYGNRGLFLKKKSSRSVELYLQKASNAECGLCVHLKITAKLPAINGHFKVDT